MGYSQVRGVAYQEGFAPTLQIETLRLICSLLASKSWKGCQVDFKTAFLNGHLDQPVFMEQPPGFEDPARPDFVCEVTRSIYGLKQAPCQWNQELHLALLGSGLSQSKYDPTLYCKVCSGKLLGSITVHVDDLAIVESIIFNLGAKFKIRADEDLHHFLSIKITRDLENRLLYMSQSHYVDNMVS
jgi:hypothetical protein